LLQQLRLLALQFAAGVLVGPGYMKSNLDVNNNLKGKTYRYRDRRRGGPLVEVGRACSRKDSGEEQDEEESTVDAGEHCLRVQQVVERCGMFD
jgi:hypothetical protein